MGALDLRLPCGRCQLYVCSRMGSSAARDLELGAAWASIRATWSDEALVSNGLGCVGPGADVSDAEIAAGVAESLGAITGAVVVTRLAGERHSQASRLNASRRRTGIRGAHSSQRPGGPSQHFRPGLPLDLARAGLTLMRRGDDPAASR